jgi:hypothetical protein
VRGLQGAKKDGGGHSRAYQNGIGFTLIDQAISVNTWSCNVELIWLLTGKVPQG